ncbi:MAG: hypothetical protein F6K55_03080 [Moorea sp. SIO4A3]|nr:hypothetical protein [Moorena sp. SIO4A3]
MIQNGLLLLGRLSLTSWKKGRDRSSGSAKGNEPEKVPLAVGHAKSDRKNG